MAMVPHERSLVNRLTGKPFALLGVDFDNTRADLQNTESAEKMTWRSWWDGRDGPIGKQWNVRFLPTIYVLDHKGVIRYKNPQGEEIDNAIDALLKELAEDSKKSQK
jgi:hypothetical protein